MTFTPEQNAQLSAPLSRDHVKTRQQSGRNLSYIEGWVAIKEANRIFGFDGWSRETVEIKCVSEREREIGQSKAQGWGVTYTVKVRITVGGVVRDGCGTGHGIDRDLGQAHESALKEAETDAMKRGLMTFGNPFGLALYDKEQNEVEDVKPAPKQQTSETIAPNTLSAKPPNAAAQWCEKAEGELRYIHTKAEMGAWCQKNAKALDKLLTTDKELYNKINMNIALRNDELQEAAA